MVFGLTGCILSPIFGYLTKHISQAALIVFMLMVSISNSIFMLAWSPSSQYLYVIFIVAMAFGISQSYANGQVRGLYILHVSEDKSVFCFATLFQTVGFLIGFLFSLLTCTRIKLIFYFCLSAFSLICYLVLIWRENRSDIVLKSDSLILFSDNCTNTEKYSDENPDIFSYKF